MSRVEIGEQVAAVERAFARLEEELHDARVLHQGRSVDEISFDLMCMGAVLATLRWLARDRDGCIQLVATKWGRE